MRENGNCSGKTVRGRDNDNNKQITPFFAGSEELEFKGTMGGDNEDKMVAMSSRNSSGEWVQHLLG
jgi:hypothetical protein